MRDQETKSRTQARRVAELSLSDRDSMFALLECYYLHSTRDTFERDLKEKDWVILLLSSADRIVGFSTLQQIPIVLNGQSVLALFSGDTAIDKEHWGDVEAHFHRAWLQHIFQLAEQDPSIRTFWFLISSAYKTYRLLPVGFREFYPTFRQPTPQFLQQLMDEFGHQKFGSSYDSAHGLIRLLEPPAVRPGVANITKKHLEDPDITFFLSRNPNHALGDELLCITEINVANLTPVGQRLLKFRTR